MGGWCLPARQWFSLYLAVLVLGDIFNSRFATKVMRGRSLGPSVRPSVRPLVSPVTGQSVSLSVKFPSDSLLCGCPRCPGHIPSTASLHPDAQRDEGYDRTAAAARECTPRPTRCPSHVVCAVAMGAGCFLFVLDLNNAAAQSAATNVIAAWSEIAVLNHTHDGGFGSVHCRPCNA